MTQAGDRTGRTGRLADVIANARAQLELFSGYRVESVTSVHRGEEGWTLCLEVLELQRVPDSTSVLGTYETQVDEEGFVLGYQRTRRYYRNQASEVDV